MSGTTAAYLTHVYIYFLEDLEIDATSPPEQVSTYCPTMSGLEKVEIITMNQR